MTEMDVLTIYTDGAARGNPGPAAFSFVIAREGQPAIEEHGCLGDATNNVAEYTALVKALERARQLGGRVIHIHSDSELMVKQMQGTYKVKHEGLRPLYEEAKSLSAGFDRVTFRHVRREQNRRADELCNEALDGAAGREHKDPEKTAAPAPTRHAIGPRKPATLPASAREEILDCLRAVACAWAAGNPNHPRPEEVWEQLWTVLEEAGALKTVQR
jgi:ribonuclease HI